MAWKILQDSWDTYEKAIELVFPLGLLVLLVSSFLMLGATTITGGAGFVKYIDLLHSRPGPALIAILVSAIGIFAFAFLAVGATALVKFKRTLDDISFIKLVNRAVPYSIRVSIAWFFLALISFILGVIIQGLGIHPIFLALTFIIIWWGAIFLPQTVVLEDLKFLPAFARSIKYSIKNPIQVLAYYAFASVLVFILLLAETVLEQSSFFYWTAPFISSIVLFMFIVPFLEMLKCEMYLTTKYRITTAGLK